MATEIALTDKAPSVHRSFSARRKKSFSSCDFTASTSSLNNGRIPLPGFVILVAFDAQHKIILYGTPADRAGLCVGDEIVEVNGTPVEGKEHAEVVRLIHKILAHDLSPAWRLLHCLAVPFCANNDQALAR
uniref:PDZ domain-containing protein n=1 Tax=Ascaris lumbricoides TaxID=6252 RepID=A0A0M3I1Z7_ASCLU